MVPPKGTLSFADTVKKKRAAIMCLGRLGKKKMREESSEGSKKIKGTVKYKDYNGKGNKMCGLVSQLIRAKKKCESEEQLNKENSEIEESDDECTEELRKELQKLQNEDSSEKVRTENEAKDLKCQLKLQKWRKICKKLTSKGN